jgi:hypothetical protein
LRGREIFVVGRERGFNEEDIRPSLLSLTLSLLFNGKEGREGYNGRRESI